MTHLIKVYLLFQCIEGLLLPINFSHLSLKLNRASSFIPKDNNMAIMTINVQPKPKQWQLQEFRSRINCDDFVFLINY